MSQIVRCKGYVGKLIRIKPTPEYEEIEVAGRKFKKQKDLLFFVDLEIEEGFTVGAYNVRPEDIELIE